MLCRQAAVETRKRQLYHDVLIIQGKLCFSFFTVRLQTPALIVTRGCFQTAFYSHRVSGTAPLPPLWMTESFAYTQWELLRSMRAHLLCAVSLSTLSLALPTPATFHSPLFRGGEKGFFRLINGGRTSSGALHSFKAIKGEHSTNDLEWQDVEQFSPRWLR